MIEELQREVVGLDKEKYEIVVIRIGMKPLSWRRRENRGK